MKCTDCIISSDPRCKYGNARLTTVDYTVQCTCVYTAQYSVLACTLHSTVYLRVHCTVQCTCMPDYYNPLNVLLSDQQCGIYMPLILWIHRCWILSISFLLYAAKIHKFNWQLLTDICFTRRKPISRNYTVERPTQ